MGRRGRDRRLAAVLFTDIVGSTEVASELGDARWRELLTRHHEIVRRDLRRYGGRERDTAGDGFFATFDAPADAVRCAVAAQSNVRTLGIEIRAGVSFGQVEQIDGKPGGLVVVAGARIMGESDAGAVLVSSAVRDVLPGAGITFEDVGVRRLKGLDDEVHVYSVTAVDGEAIEHPESDQEVARLRRGQVTQPEPAANRRWMRAGAGLIGVIVLAGLFALIRAMNGEEPAAPPAGPPQNALISLDPESGEPGQMIPVSNQPQEGRLYSTAAHLGAAGEGGVWLVRDTVILHVNPVHHEVREPPVTNASWGAGVPLALDIGMGRLWASNGSLFTIDGGTDDVTPFARPDLAESAYGVDMTVGGGWIWIADSTGTVWRIDPERPADIGSIAVPSGQVDAVVADTRSVWTYDSFDDSVTHIDPETLEPSGPRNVSSGVDDIAILDGELWVLSVGSGAVFRFGNSTAASVGSQATCLVPGFGALWVGDENGDLYRISPFGAEAERIYRAGGAIRTVIPDEESGVLWVDVGPG